MRALVLVGALLYSGPVAEAVTCAAPLTAHIPDGASIPPVSTHYVSWGWGGRDFSRLKVSGGTVIARQLYGNTLVFSGRKTDRR